ncbi:MAG: lamin tail domain-containing protein, partial [bacterium]|nr:lamin tail domain-containing protein [bacterium]
GIIKTQAASDALYFLDVGQGDSQLLILSSENGGHAIKILIDGGKDKNILNAMDDALGNSNDKYIDLIILTHTDLDHMGGLIDIIKRYEVGAFISSGRESTSEAYGILKETLANRKIPTLALRQGDVIRYGDNRLAVLSPDRYLVESKAVNEDGLVMMLKMDDELGGTSALFTGDVGFPTENWLLDKKEPIYADILKVGHHGSKYSSGENFIATVRPLISVIGVGKNNYGHPATRVLETLELAGSRVYRTDKNGTVKVLLGYEDKHVEKPAGTGILASVASVMTGNYKNTKITTVFLQQVRKEMKESNLVPYKKCSFNSGGVPSFSPVIINEIAWMGSISGATHEWIELRRVSKAAVNMSGWQLINENERLRITFPQKSLFDRTYMTLARSAADNALNLDAKIIFTGSLRNSNEGLRLYDNECNLVDEVQVSSKWVAGNNSSKQTMERINGLLWSTSAVVGGTPNGENSATY